VVEGLSHITFITSDPDGMAKFSSDVFDAEEVYSSGDETFSISKEKFFLVGGVWIAAMEGDPLSEKTYNHTAFKIADEEYERYAERIRALGVEIREGRNRVEGEGGSLYFHDHDNHLFELHTGTLEQRLNRYAKK
jgi:catechol 2,3-dioxygenase-like lactoylglutathione lyase family enzyme